MTTNPAPSRAACVGALLQRVNADGLANVSIVQHDAVEVLES